MVVLKEWIDRFWKVSLIKRNRMLLLVGMISIIVFVITGCSDNLSKVLDIRGTAKDNEISFVSDIGVAALDNEIVNADNIAAIYRDIYEEAVKTNTLGSLETKEHIVVRLGEHGYVAVDSENQVDMAGAEQAVKFCKAVEEKKSDKLTIIVIMELGFQKFDLETEDGNVNIVKGYYQYDKNGCLQNKSMVNYAADLWQYTEEGYIILEGNYFSDENFVLTLSDAMEHTVLRVLPLDEKCREWNRKFILPIGYGQNNIFLTDWNEEDFGDLNFYDVFDKFYPILYGQPVPYAANENLGVETIYEIPEEIFENVIMTYFNVERELLRSKTIYQPEKASYEYRPRGFYEAEHSEIPYPEVVNYMENDDGTITLIINAVYPNENTSKSFSHKIVIRPLGENRFQYISNQMLSDDYDIWWHSKRFTEEEWKEISDNIVKESETESSLYFLPQAENCLISEAEKIELKKYCIDSSRASEGSVSRDRVDRRIIL